LDTLTVFSLNLANLSLSAIRYSS